MQNAHMEALMTKHASLDARIMEESLRPHPDDATLARLKKEKLRLRDEMTGH
ncbi:MAG: YdcH family protein [Allosphingosinicella sp.]|uniref:YdcH family protein n=1 Tax=Allosphingosinicella sp. TaxID=2823234 RepID=UPI003928E3AB